MGATRTRPRGDRAMRGQRRLRPWSTTRRRHRGGTRPRPAGQAPSAGGRRQLQDGALDPDGVAFAHDAPPAEGADGSSSASTTRSPSRRRSRPWRARSAGRLATAEIRPARPGPVGAAGQRREVRRARRGGSEVATDEAGGRLRLAVIDHGPGVSEMDRLGSSAASSAAAVNRARTGRSSGCTSRANSCARWAATPC